MPDVKLPLTHTVVVSGATADDVRVIETRRPHAATPADSCHVEVARGPVAMQIIGPLEALMVVVAEMAQGLTRIRDARRTESR